MSTAKYNKELPIHVLQRTGMTMRHWKVLKRKQLREVMKIYNQFKDGCAYTPAYEHVHEFEDKLKAMLEAIKPSNWT